MNAFPIANGETSDAPIKGGSTISPATALMAVSNGRPIKFTPERMEQIKNLVERGISREQIAETIGVTLGSLQVTCSRMGISLRRPKPTLAAPARRLHKPTPTAADHEKKCCHVAIAHGQRTLGLKLSQDLLSRLAIEACFENLTLSEIISKLLTSALANSKACEGNSP
jgi:hypothetical protein